jgi:hypothetical protein
MTTSSPLMRWRPIEVLCACKLGLAAALLALGSLAQAQDQPRWGGEVAVSGWSSNRVLDDRRGLAAARVALTLDWRPTTTLQLRADAWTAGDSHRTPSGKRALAGAKEAFAALRTPCAPALGKRVVAWGRADAINPTDQVTPSDYRRLVPEESEQRKGVWGLHLNCALGQGRLQGHVIDPRAFHSVPYGAQPGLSVLEERPRVRPTLALKYDVTGSGLDWSLSTINGTDLHPTLVLRGQDSAGLRLGQTGTPMRLVGADAAFSQGSRVWRAEAAWVDYENSADPWVARRRSWASAVLQVEWSFGERQSLSLQGFVKRLRGSAAVRQQPVLLAIDHAQGLLANEVDRNQRGLTLRYAWPLVGERTDAELLLIGSQPRNDAFVRLRITHALNDQLRLTLGADGLDGPADSYLGNLRRNSAVFAEISHSW